MNNFIFYLTVRLFCAFLEVDIVTMPPQGLSASHGIRKTRRPLLLLVEPSRLSRVIVKTLVAGCGPTEKMLNYQAVSRAGAVHGIPKVLACAQCSVNTVLKEAVNHNIY